MKPTDVSKDKKQVFLLASGDLRLSANQTCWPAQQEMEKALTQALAEEGYVLVRAHPFKESEQHGFLASQREGIEAFKDLDPHVPIIVAEAVWQYSHHVLAGLTTHKGPILTLANWSGQWPGLVGLLNLNGSLTKAGVKYSTIWSQDFTDDFFKHYLRKWLRKGYFSHELDHVHPLRKVVISKSAKDLGQELASQLKQEKAIMGVLDEGCMGMFNAIIPDQLLHNCGVFKERLSQSSLYYESQQVSDEEAQEVVDWLLAKGMKFHFGEDEETELTPLQVLTQAKMYIAALRIADDYGCDTIGIQYQQGLKDLLPASDLVEGMLNNVDRPPVKSRDGSKILFEGKSMPHFNEVDECAGLDALMTTRVHEALGQPVENTLHDVRYGEYYGEDYVWVFLISGAAPPAHFINGWRGAEGMRQPPMYFPKGGSTLKGISRPGEMIWSRIYVKDEVLHMDLGRGAVIQLPDEETQRRWNITTKEWPIMHAVTYGINRDQLMAKHQANHIHVAYADSCEAADECLFVKAAMAEALGMKVHLCGKRTRYVDWKMKK